MSIAVAVTGLGIVGPLGRGPRATSEALQAGRSGIVKMPQWAEHKIRSLIAGWVDPAPLREGIDRKVARFMSDSAVLGATAVKDAVAHAALSEAEIRHDRAGVILGTGAGSSIPDAVALGERIRERGGSRVGPYQVPLIMGSGITANLGVLLGFRGACYSVSSACSTSAHAIMIGFDLIRSGRQDRVVAGGAEDINYISISGFDGMGALSTKYNDTPERASRPLDRGRDGFVFGGGAAAVVLERLDLAKARGAAVLAVLRGAAATCDGNDMVVPNGTGGERVMKLAMEDAGVRPEEIDYINLHGTSTPVGDTIEVQAIRNAFPKVPPFSSTKSMTGHGMGAAGAQEAVYCVLMLQDGFLAPNINLEDPEPIVRDLPIVTKTQRTTPRIVLSNSFGFGGTNCALVFGAH